MKRHVAVVLMAGALLGLLGACATTDWASTRAVPESLRVSASQVLFVRARPLEPHAEYSASPAAGCSGSQAGSEARVNYSADSLFYKAR